MKPTLEPGLARRFGYKFSENGTVPHLYPALADFRAMPGVFAAGFLKGPLEWVCMPLLAPHLDPGEGSVGVQFDINPTAATPPGMTWVVDVRGIVSDGARVAFEVSAHDGLDLIGEGGHQRFVVAWNKFDARLDQKAKSLAATS